MEIFSTPVFLRSLKKLYQNQKRVLNQAIEVMRKNPSIGELKKGDLSNVRVHKFYMINCQTLIAYEFDKEKIILLAFGSHENFYNDLKK